MIWNSLPDSLKEIRSLQWFKRKLECLLNNNYSPKWRWLVDLIIID